MVEAIRCSFLLCKHHESEKKLECGINTSISQKIGGVTKWLRAQALTSKLCFLICKMEIINSNYLTELM